MAAPILEDLHELFCELLSGILDLAESINLRIADPEYVTDKTEEFIEVFGVVLCTDGPRH